MGFGLDDVPLKTATGATHGLALPLRQVLVMVNGSRTVRELLALGIRGVEQASFDQLSALGLVRSAADARPGGGAAGVAGAASAAAGGAAAAPAARTVAGYGLSEARFAVVDLLYGITTRDFAARSWIERMEAASDMARLRAEVEAFIASPVAAGQPALHAALRQALG